MLRDPIFYILLSGVLAPAFIGTTIFFHQAHLTELRDYPALAFAGAFPLMAGTTVLFGLACGYLVDRFGAVRILPFFLLPLACATFTAAFVDSIAGIYLFMIMFGVNYGLTSTMAGDLRNSAFGRYPRGDCCSNGFRDSCWPWSDRGFDRSGNKSASAALLDGSMEPRRHRRSGLRWKGYSGPKSLGVRKV